MKKLIFTLCVMLFIVGISLSLIFLSLNSPVQSEGSSVEFRINRYEPVFSITERLEDEGIIRSAVFLRLLTRVMGTDGDFRFGIFLLSPAQSTVVIHDLLMEGKEVLQKVRLREGLTVSKIADEVSRHMRISSEEFLAEVADSSALEKYNLPYRNVEGFLFPDTYFFSQESDATQIVHHMVDTLFTNLATIGVYPEYFSPSQFYETLILASIVEREYVAASEASKIASVFVNRLRTNMKLQSCATIVYLLTEEQGREHPSRLFFSDLEHESSYNTYLHKGLPPTPISNAGIVALEAAFFPAETDYWFFVLKGRDASEHYFSRSGTEHLEAALLYLKDPS